jgi:hypothetical protein
VKSVSCHAAKGESATSAINNHGTWEKFLVPFFYARISFLRRFVRYRAFNEKLANLNHASVNQLNGTGFLFY